MNKFLKASFVLALALVVALAITKINLPIDKDTQSEPPAQLSAEAQESYEAKLEEHNKKLKAVIDNWVRDHSGYEWSIVVRGLDSDQRSASIEPNKAFSAASLYKLYLMIPVLDDYSLDELRNTFVSGSSLEACTDLMLRISDNPCGEAIGRFIGWDAADTAASRAGYTSTSLNVTDPQTTAGETARFMTSVYNKQVGGAGGKRYIMDKLSQQSWDDGIPAGCPDCLTFNKTGDLGYVRHDAAIISGDSGSYVLVIFSTGAPYSQIAQLTKLVNNAMTSSD